jgi:hypothetical protein
VSGQLTFTWDDPEGKLDASTFQVVQLPDNASYFNKTPATISVVGPMDFTGGYEWVLLLVSYDRVVGTHLLHLTTSDGGLFLERGLQPTDCFDSNPSK